MTRHEAGISDILTFELALTNRLRAHDWAARTKPSISAPEKFFVMAANSSSLTVLPNFPFSFIFRVWILKIWLLPFSFGRAISIWTSSLPGRRRASSIMSRRLVIPMTRMLLSWSTPSILDSNWLTTVSLTPLELPAYNERCFLQ